MNMTARSLSGLASAVVVTTIFVFGVQTPSQGQAGKDRDVKVVNTTSDPVQAAIVGTPTVLLGNPTVALHPDWNKVVIANDPATPAMVRDVDARPREPFKISSSTQLTPGDSSAIISFLTVPNGKRFVLEGVSARAVLPMGEKVLLAVHAVEPDQTLVTMFVPLTHQGTFNSGDHYMGTEPFTLTLGSGGLLTAEAARGTILGTFFIQTTVVGYFEDAP